VATKHLLLDLDGTLIHSGNFLLNFEFIARILPMLKHFRGWKVAFRTLKEMQDVVKTPHAVKSNQERVIEIFQTNFNISREEAETHLLKSINSVFPKLESHFGKILGAASFIEWAKDHYTLTLATNPMWSSEIVQMRMRWGGINPDHFKSITTIDRMHACKPLPEYYQELLRQENFEAKDCLLIGNERKMDLPATKVGIPVFLIRPTTGSLTCIRESDPGAWRGSYTHLKEFLLKQK
jgi:FMN phosphatase YigB (HAD superfamily)